MPLYMDIHKKVEGATAEAVVGAHAKDLEVHVKYDVDYNKILGRREQWKDFLPSSGAEQGSCQRSPSRSAWSGR